MSATAVAGAPAETGDGCPIRTFVGSTIGAKVLMALTGLGLVGFLVTHLLGNLLAFKGQRALNEYAHGLQSLGGLLWAARAGLLGIFVLHVGLALHLERRNAKAAPLRYAVDRTLQASFASRHMMLTGGLVGSFLVYHLAHFTFGYTNPEHFLMRDPPGDPAGLHDVYAGVVLGFRNPVVATAYLVAMGFLCLHLWHGFGSLWRTLGVSSPRLVRWLRLASAGLALVIACGFASVPVGVWTGVITLPGGAP
jgi:succinate dehydrogenase / fumarate reductase cytochrome b subunit